MAPGLTSPSPHARPPARTTPEAGGPTVVPPGDDAEQYNGLAEPHPPFTPPGPSGWKVWLTRWPARWPAWVRVWGLPVAATGLAVVVDRVIGLAFRGHDAIAVLYVIPVLLCAYVGGWRTGLVATALAAASFAWFSSPTGEPVVHEPYDTFRLISLLLVAIGVVFICEALLDARTRSDVSARTLRNVDRRLRLALAAAETAVWQIDLASGQLTATGSSQAMFGTDHGPVDAVVAGIVDEDRPLWEQALRTSFLLGRPFAVEFRRGEAAGSVRWVRCQGDCTRDAKGRVTGISGVAIDVTARRTAEMLRRESEARFRHLADTLPALVWMSDDHGRCIYFNRTWLEFSGKTGDSLAGPEPQKPGWTQDVHPDDRFTLEDWHQTHARHGDLSARMRLRRADGQWRWMLFTGSPRVTPGGAYLGMIGAAIDVTSQIEAEEALRRGEARMRHLFNSGNDWILVFPVGDDGSPGPFIEVNDEASRRLGYTRERLLTMDISRVVAPEIPAGENIRKVIEEGVYRFDSMHVASDGRRLPVEVNASTFVIEGMRVIQAICRDVSARRELETRLRATADELSAANRSKDEFLAALSHELRNPLNPVLLTLSSYQDDPSLPEPLREDWAMMTQNVQLEARLIDDLLDLTRVRRGKLELQLKPTDMRTVIDRGVDVCCHAADPQTTPAVLVEHNVTRPVVVGDAARLQQVVWNLLSNALKFTPADGVVTVRTRVTEVTGAGHVEIEVADTGIGIDPSQLDSIFDAFEQGGRDVTRRFGGLGLGLAITRRLAELHGGTITASSDGPGRGSVFRVVLPLTDVEADSTPLSGAAPSAFPGAADVSTPMRILLVEDHPSTAKVMARLLARLGHDVINSATVAGALKAAEAEAVQGRRIDLVVSDLGLPDGTGHDLMRHLRNRYGLRGIALSGYGMDADVQASREAGFEQHLTKPVDLTQLVRALRTSGPADT